MLKSENYTLSNIMDIRARTGADPTIIERTVYAFGLLEAVTRTGMPFVFKGGTSLMILLKEPRRLSTDIDIIVEPGINIDDYIQKAGTIFPFSRVVERNRSAKYNIEKRHFRFCFVSPRSGEEFNILLDVVFEKNPYERIEEKEIDGDYLLTEGDNLKVKVPDKNCILADKLTAFAPHTIGVPFRRGSEPMYLEIIKQMFDCWTILQEMDDYQTVSRAYDMVSRIEMNFREIALEKKDCLLDTIKSCICILGEGSIQAEEYAQYYAGINALQTHIFNGKMNGQEAGRCACGVMYLATCLLTDTNYERIEDPEAYRPIKLPLKGIKKISRLRNIDTTAYAYMIKSIQLLQEKGYYRESIV